MECWEQWELSEGAGWRSLIQDISLDISLCCWIKPGSITHLTRTDSRDRWDGSSFLTVHLPETRDCLPNVCFCLGKQKVTDCVYILAPCTVFFLFFNTKSSIALTRPIINHYFTDKLWECDPAISSCKIFTAAGENISFYLFRCMNFFKIARKAVVG